MKVHDFYKEILLLKRQMDNFVDPKNQQGFYSSFVDWVVESWSEGEYSGCNLLTLPKNGGQPTLSDCETTYEQFLKARRRDSDAPSGVVGSNANYKSILCDNYEQLCLMELCSLIDSKHINLPDNMSLPHEATVVEAILLELFDEDEFKKINVLAKRFNKKFGDSGEGLEPYLLGEEGLFKACTFEDFLAMQADIKKGTRRKV